MGKSQETFGKKELEKKKLKKRQDKEEKMQERKASSSKGKSLDDMLAYIDENGNLSSTPPDPSRMKEINAEDIQLGVVHNRDEEQEDNSRKGIITNFNTAKGYGFIRDEQSGESIFVHASNMKQPLNERDAVSFRVEKGPKGLHAVDVKKR